MLPTVMTEKYHPALYYNSMSQWRVLSEGEDEYRPALIPEGPIRLSHDGEDYEYEHKELEYNCFEQLAMPGARNPTETRAQAPIIPEIRVGSRAASPMTAQKVLEDKIAGQMIYTKAMLKADFVPTLDDKSKRDKTGEWEMPRVKKRSTVFGEPFFTRYIRARGDWFTLLDPVKLCDMTNEIMEKEDAECEWRMRFGATDIEVKELLQDAMEEFVEDLTTGACLAAAHRGAQEINAGDLELFLQRQRGREAVKLDPAVLERMRVLHGILEQE